MAAQGVISHGQVVSWRLGKRARGFDVCLSECLQSHSGAAGWESEAGAGAQEYLPQPSRVGPGPPPSLFCPGELTTDISRIHRLPSSSKSTGRDPPTLKEMAHLLSSLPTLRTELAQPSTTPLCRRKQRSFWSIVGATLQLGDPVSVSVAPLLAEHRAPERHRPLPASRKTSSCPERRESV